MALVRCLPVAMLSFLFMVCKGRYHSDTDLECNNVAGPEMIQVIDTQAAEHMQKHHLEILFNRYGENGSISIEGLKKLLESIGLDRIKKVPVRDGHFEIEHEDHHQRGHNHHPHHHPHLHHHPYQHKIPASKKAAETPKIIRNNLTVSKKTEDSNSHHKLYAKKVIHEISTTPMYTTNILLKSSEMRNRRSVDHPSDAAGLSTTAGTGFAKRDVLETTKLSPVSNLLVSGEHGEPAESGKEEYMHTDDHDNYEHLEHKNQKKLDHIEESLDVDDKQPSKEESQNIKQNDDLEGKTESNMKDQSQFAPQQPPDTPEEEEVMLAPALSQDGYNEYTAQGCENKCHSHFHDTIGQADDLHHHHHDYHHILHHHHSQNHHPHSHSHHYSREQFKGAGIATLAWMVIMGDGLHNFSDGLAIGAAFTEGISSGLSTSVAVFCHELPHELGDFAVLLKAGMTVKQAILYNMLSAMMAYLGMITGILIGHYAENISMWIFALTAGLFMYVALVDMVPEMLHNDAGDHGFSHCGYFLLQNAGILLGFSIMLVIAIFEDKILLDIKL
ncbi:Zinc transporter ZIP6 [Acipenser ruthenus]|uniref:Zinc transporter ZIP6 n=1 Tax=Acipenser ruthenus TaxID=7906 RepID=A0A662YU26_ACIRT|nr:Zinc transporter ZIP6 [Acipenser ruthenus]